MKRLHKIATAIFVGLALALVFVAWTIAPLIGPLSGVRRTPDELIEFITRHNIVCLVDPVPLIKESNGSYGKWALAELEMRRNTAVVLWIAGVVPLGLWAARSKGTRNGVESGEVKS
jgi:hypothetical protein